jgi:hypothetical protein
MSDVRKIFMYVAEEWDFFNGFLAHSGSRPLINSVIIYSQTEGLLMSDQPVARPLPKHRTTQTQNKRIHTPNIHALSGIWTHDPSVRANEDVHALDDAATMTGWEMGMG